VVLAQAMATEALRQRLAGSSPMAMQRGIRHGVELAVQSIQDQSRYFERRDQIAHVAGVSAGDPEVGEIIANAMDYTGKEGFVTVGRSTTPGMELVFEEGMRIDAGYLSQYFITDPERMEAVLDDPYILITDLDISSVQQLLPLLERVVQSGRALVVIARSLGEDALAPLVVNKIRGILKSAAVKAPGSGDRKALLTDVAIVTGGVVLSEEVGLKLELATLDLLGRARRITVTKDGTTIVEGAGSADDIKGRIAQIRQEIENTDSDDDRRRLRERLAKLAGGVATIKLGGTTEAEFEDRKRLIERAYAVAHSAIEEGIVAGGGTALLRAQAALASRSDAAETVIVQRGLEEPLRQIAINAGQDPTEVLGAVRELGPATAGFDAAAGTYADLFEAGVIDSAKVLRVAIESAGATVVQFLSVI
jgi:chaperonin GroEL